MNFACIILAALFSHAMYGLLRLCGWKRKTVYANLRHVFRSQVSLPVIDGFCKSPEGRVAKNPCELGMANRDFRNGVAVDSFKCSSEGGSCAACEISADKAFCEKMYCELLHNLTRHVGELLFCFNTFKRLPSEFAAYPCRMDGCNFDLAPGAAETLDKMRCGGIFLTAHYGNYEAMGPWLCRLGIPLVASYIPVKPAWLNRILEGRIRAVDGRSYSVNARTPREFLRLLNDGKLFCLLADQDSRIPSALAGEFMGRAVHNNPLPDFLLKHRPETPVFVCWIEERDGCHDSHKCSKECDAQNVCACQAGRCFDDQSQCATRILHAEQILVQPVATAVRSPASKKSDTATEPCFAQSATLPPATEPNSISPASKETGTATEPCFAQSAALPPATEPNSMSPASKETGTATDSFSMSSAPQNPEPLMAQYNAWIKNRIAENPALWYGFTHRRFYSKNPEIYK